MKVESEKLNAAEQLVFENHNLVSEEKNIRIWESVNWRGQLFTSTNYREVKSINYFVCLSDSSLGTVQFYFKYDNNFYAFFEKFEVLFETDHLLEKKSTSLLSIQKIETIVDKLLFMRINMRNIVTRVPTNTKERDQCTTKNVFTNIVEKHLKNKNVQIMFNVFVNSA